MDGVILKAVRAIAWGSALALIHAPGASAIEGYITDNYGNVVTDNNGDCVVSSTWSAADATERCHPQLVAQMRAVEEVPAAPTTAQRPPRQVSRVVNLEADTTFDFDQADLTDRGKQELDKIVDASKDARDPRVRIVGYADHIGPEQYNEDLSRRRAEAVMEYLTENGLPSDSIQLAARGESNPVVSCEGMSGNALIECLRPNRRSEVEFSAFEIVDEDASEQTPQSAPSPAGNGSAEE
jgi:OOP family OmpA-OmpF porin